MRSMVFAVGISGLQAGEDVKVPSEVPPILVCSGCHAAVLTSADAAVALRAKVLRAKVLRGRHSLALQRAESLFERRAS